MLPMSTLLAGSRHLGVEPLRPGSDPSLPDTIPGGAGIMGLRHAHPRGAR
jgi:hypothetical protein